MIDAPPPAGTREPEIALVLSADAWVDDLHRYCTDHGGARVRCMVVEPGVALDEHFDVLVTSDRWPALTRPFVDELHARGRRVLVVHDGAVDADALVRVGVDGTVSAETAPAALVAEVLAVAPERAPTDDGLRFRSDDPVARGEGRPRAPVIAVGGPPGSGSTEVALALAAAANRRGRAVVVDADDRMPAIAARLGLPVEPNLCTAVDAVVYGLGSVVGALFDLGEEWPAVLTGAPTRRAALALRGTEVAAVAAALGESYAPVVLDVGAGGAGADGRADVLAAAVGQASVLVAVSAPTPVGIVRLLEWLRMVAPEGFPASVHVVVNRAPASRRRRAELAGEVQSGWRVTGLTFAPVDTRVEDASWAATLVERGPFVRAIDAVSDACADVLGDRLLSGARFGRRR